jgi:Uncharacterized conserved protein
MAFDFKKVYKDFYMPPAKPMIIDIPVMNFVAVSGKGDSNQSDGEYAKALNLLYGISYTLKMSSKSSHTIDGFFDYIVPPLEGFWRQNGSEIGDINYADKGAFEWISLIRLPDFITRADFDWAVSEATRKKKTDFTAAEFFTYSEGLCVQCMHVGSYDDEPATIASMESFAAANGFKIDITENRHHHEIYLSDPRKTEVAKVKTIIRHPIKKAGGAK